MSKELTCKQAKVLVYIKNFIKDNGYPPTSRNISDSFGITVKGSFDYLKILERKGFIKVIPKISRGIVVL